MEHETNWQQEYQELENAICSNLEVPDNDSFSALGCYVIGLEDAAEKIAAYEEALGKITHAIEDPHSGSIITTALGRLDLIRSALEDLDMTESERIKINSTAVTLHAKLKTDYMFLWGAATASMNYVAKELETEMRSEPRAEQLSAMLRRVIAQLDQAGNAAQALQETQVAG